ncbi:hypothetical protein BSR28_06665 [Boudabousia liubingyangii]|uniref:TPM domain-containing protein n=1 Tax=Boudabousia liubingyangii TaxID=1921764 RepID=UPI00093C2EA5|nr:TPM domain-containing protein [Boudabousia liubingyangii]OKL47082.1 hypothetical protein BSR28_06665 [Boudabousia liubingyangii]
MGNLRHNNLKNLASTLLATGLLVAGVSLPASSAYAESNEWTNPITQLSDATVPQAIATTNLERQKNDHADWLVKDEAEVLTDPNSLAISLEKLGNDPQVRLALLNTSKEPFNQYAIRWAEANGVTSRDLVFIADLNARRYTVVRGPSVRITQSELESLDKMFKSSLIEGIDSGNWDEAMHQLVNQLEQTKVISSGRKGAVEESEAPGSTNDQGPAEQPTSNRLLSWIPKLFIFLVLPLIVVMVFLQKARRDRGSLRGDTHQTPLPPGTDPTLAQLPIKELEQVVSSTLMSVDNGLKDARQELTFAQAQFGRTETEDFESLLNEVSPKLTDAWDLFGRAQKQSDEQTMRLAYLKVLDEVKEIDSALAQRKQAFQKLRTSAADLQTGVPNLREKMAELTRLNEHAEAEITSVKAAFPSVPLDSLDALPGRINNLLDAAEQALKDCERARKSQDSSLALHRFEVAQRTYTQAFELHQQVATAFETLGQIDKLIVKAISSISSDIDDANRLAQNNSALQSFVSDAKAEIEKAQAARAGQVDPLEVLSSIGKAERALDEALVPYRSEEQNFKKKVEQASKALANARPALFRAANFISNNRGAVGPKARVDLETAQAAAASAREILQTSPEKALEEIARMEELSAAALRQANVDVQRATPSAQDPEGYVREESRSPNAPSVLAEMFLTGLLNDYSRHDWGSRSPSWGSGYDDSYSSSSGGFFGGGFSSSSGGSFSSSSGGGFSSSSGGSF